MAACFFLAFALLPCSVLAGVIHESIQCKPVGTKSITILWKYSQSEVNDSLAFDVYFCKFDSKFNCLNTSINFQLGCTVNATKGRSKYQCDIGKALNLKIPNQHTFNYYVKTVYRTTPVKEGIIDHLVRCPVLMQMECPKRSGLKLEPVDRGSLKLSWSPPTDMGNMGLVLCYIIEYFPDDNPQSKYEQTYEDMGNYEVLLKSLLPYKKYHVFIRCECNCHQNTSRFAGPVTATTLEEEPQGSVIFEKSFQEEVDPDTRNITVSLKIPNKDKWNGKIKEIRVFCCNNQHCCKNISLSKSFQLDGQLPLQFHITIPYLKRNKSYQIKADYCNGVGCSAPSQNLTINPLPFGRRLPNVDEVPKEKFQTLKKVGWIAVGCVGFVIILILAFMAYRCYRRRHNEPPNERNLNDVVGQLPPVAIETSHDQEQNEDYTTANDQCTSRTTLKPETTDFLSASVRSLESFNLTEERERDSGDLVTLINGTGSPPVQQGRAHDKEDKPLTWV